MREHSRENPGREDAAEGRIEGRNAVAEAIRSGVSIDKLYIAKGETDRTSPAWPPTPSGRGRWWWRRTGGSWTP